MNIEPIRSKLEKSSLFAPPPNKTVVVGRNSENNPELPNHPEFLIFGEAPGKQENKEGIPFVGRAGKILNNWIIAAGIKGKCYISNVLPFIPLDSVGKIRTPSPEELLEYRFFRNWVIQQVNSTFIITLGDSATWALTRKKTRELLGGAFFLFDNRLTAIYHPQYYSHRGIVKKGREDFINAIKLLRDLKEKGDEINEQ